MAKQSVEVSTSCFGEQQRRRAALLAPPAEDRLAGAQFARRDAVQHAEDVVVGESCLVIAGRRRAVEHHRNQAVAIRFLELLHELFHYLVHKWSLPVAGCAAAAGIAAAESSEAVPGIEPSESAAPAAAVTRPPAHQVTENQPRQDAADSAAAAVPSPAAGPQQQREAETARPGSSAMESGPTDPAASAAWGAVSATVRV